MHDHIKIYFLQDRKKSFKSIQKKKTFQRFWKYCWRNKGLFIFGTIGLIFATLSLLAIPYLCGEIVDAMSSANRSYDKLKEIGYQFMVAVAIGGVFSFVRGYCFNVLGEHVSLELKSDFYGNVLQKDVEFYDSNKSGEILSRLTNDTTQVSAAASDNMSILIRQIIQFVGSLVLLFTISWKLTLVLLIAVPPFALCLFLFIKYYKKFSIQYQMELSKANAQASEVLSNIRIVKSFATEKKEAQQFKDCLKLTFAAGKRRGLMYAIFLILTVIIVYGCVLGVLWYGGSMVINEDLSVGDLSSFILYTLALSIGMTSSAGQINLLITAIGVAEYLFDIMDQKPKIVSGQKKVPDNEHKGNISFNNVDFNYPTKTSVKVLDQINLNIQPGENLAIVGSSGSGKSTIVSLMERFYDCSKGEIMIDDVNVREQDWEKLHQNIGFVSQEPALFSGSIKQNIVYGVENYTNEQIEDAIVMANAKEFISNKDMFPDGLETMVGERGVKLSGGQKQRIAIARALIKNPKILIFDEATSALDAESEFQVQKAIQNLVARHEKTIIIIAHRLSTIQNCDRILVLKQGQIVEQGDHNALLQKNGIYKKLVERQLNKTDLDIDNL